MEVSRHCMSMQYYVDFSGVVIAAQLVLAWLYNSATLAEYSVL